MRAQLLSVAARFPARDFDATAAFYARLGFHEVSRHGGVYLILRRGGAELHFTPGPETWDPAQSWQSAYVRVLNMGQFMADLGEIDLPSEGIPRFTPAATRDWGMIEAYAVDPDGHLVIFGAPLETPLEPAP